MKAALLALAAIPFAAAQQVGSLTAENAPKISVARCTKSGGCTASTQAVTLDSNWRWLHSTSGSNNCYTGNTWDTTLCPDPTTCASNCALDGADYSGTYGITASGTALTLKFVTKGPYSTNIGSRTYLLDSTGSKYEMLKLMNKEFTFDVDVSQLPCGLNGALYLVSMDADGGLSKYSTNKAGAKYGTGYCDSQCPRDIKFIAGKANIQNWTPSSNDSNAGMGSLGTCCSEMDIWEANSISAAYTPHPCSTIGYSTCNGTSCGGTSNPDDRYASVCDPDGCDFNSYRQGDKTFYGPGMTIDTTKPFTVVTQFITSDGTDSGSLSEIKRFYVQGGKTYANSQSTISGISGNSITAAYCKAQKTVFGDTDSFNNKGGLTQMGKALAQGMVLVMSVWDDHAVNMLWLDSTFPTDKPASQPGIGRGTCATSSGVPSYIEANQGSSQVIYSNIKWGELGSTFNPNGVSTTTAGNGGTTAQRTTTTTVVGPRTTTTTPRVPTTTTTARRTTTTTTTARPSPTGGNCSSKWGQCGGQGYNGPTCCQSGSTCQYSNPWYSQCL